MFLCKQVALSYNIAKKPYYENLKWAKHGFANNLERLCWMAGEGDFKKWASNDIYFENMLELKPNTIPNSYEKDSCWLFENKK